MNSSTNGLVFVRSLRSLRLCASLPLHPNVVPSPSTDRTASHTNDLNKAWLAAGCVASYYEQWQGYEKARLLEEIHHQRETIQGMSIPVLPVTSKILVVPLVGELDAYRLHMLQEHILHTLERSSARYLVMDITGVLMVDSQIAQGLVSVVQAARLLGVRVMLVGVRPDVAQAIVELGLDLSSIRTAASLQESLRLLMR